MSFEIHTTGKPLSLLEASQSARDLQSALHPNLICALVTIQGRPTARFAVNRTFMLLFQPYITHLIGAIPNYRHCTVTASVVEPIIPLM